MRDGSGVPGGRRHERRPRLVVAGSIFFALLAVATLVDLAREVPLEFGGDLATPEESLMYRVSAAVTCAALAGWLYLAGVRRKPDGP